MRVLQVTLLVVFSFILQACATTEKVDAKQSGKSSRINVELGITYMKEGKYNTAMDRLQKAIRQDPDNPLAYSSMALLNMRLQQLDEAETNFEKAVKLAPDNSSIRNNYGALLCQKKRYKQAQEQFMQAIKNPLYNTPEHAYLNAGKCTEDKAEAEKYFRAALRTNPIFPGALLEMASLSLELKRYLPARAYLQRLHAVQKPIAASLWISIQVEKVLGDQDTMQSHALFLQGEFPDSEETRKYLQWKQNE
jgi:type IV pilus assembly protein PilF